MLTLHKDMLSIRNSETVDVEWAVFCLAHRVDWKNVPNEVARMCVQSRWDGGDLLGALAMVRDNRPKKWPNAWPKCDVLVWRTGSFVEGYREERFFLEAPRDREYPTDARKFILGAFFSEVDVVLFADENNYRVGRTRTVMSRPK